MDIVICVALKDCFFLNKNFAFIVDNLKPDNIFVITDKRNFRYINVNEYPVFLIDENSLIDGLTFPNVKKLIDKYLNIRNYGWYYQQFLKLGFAMSKYAKDEYLTWDADTVPLCNLSFKDEEGHVLYMPKKERHSQYFKTIDSLFLAPRKAPHSFIGEHMLFKVDVVKEMLSLIEKNGVKHLSWYEQCLAAIHKGTLQGFSEFETYGTYCLNYYPELMAHRFLNTFRQGSKIYGVMASKKEIESLSFDLDTVSFEINAMPVSVGRRIEQLFLKYLFKLIVKFRIKYKGFPL